MEQESMGPHQEERREGLGVEEWRAGILAGSITSVPFEFGDEGRASNCTFRSSEHRYLD